MIPEPALDALRALLDRRLDASGAARDAHAQSESWFPPTPPDAVAWPESTEEVAAILRICAEHRVPVVGWGAGTSLEAQALAVRGGLCLDFTRMNRVLEVRPEDMLARVQPGVTRRQLDAELRQSGLFFPVDPGADATIGGMAATRASGTTTVRYGSMRDNVAALEVVLADGRVIRTGSAARKSAAGYDLTALMLGSEGTLGLITELTLRLHGRPEAVSAAVAAFDDIGAAVETVIATIQSGLVPARMEFIDAATARAVNAYSHTDLPESAHLLVEFHGSPARVAEEAEAFGALVREFGGQGYAWSAREEERSRLWRARHHAYWAILASRPGARAIVTDICVPISRLAEAVTETRADIDASPIEGPILGHVGDGNFHAILLIDPGDEAQLAAAKALAERMAERALRLGGTITGEHGVGLGKAALLRREHGPAVEVMAAIKRTLDPAGILNPGKIFTGN
ncbi:MAG: FAD-binding protein [Alphaproteobacteria bacterium]|nr:MAG: FAD-binding protein [Alphaproteobacteria bacterium]